MDCFNAFFCILCMFSCRLFTGPRIWKPRYCKCDRTVPMSNEKKTNNFNFSGYIEGNELMNGEVNVIVSDGFTGNIALKTAEGTANFITGELKKALKGSLIGKISSIMNFSNLNKFQLFFYLTLL